MTRKAKKTESEMTRLAYEAWLETGMAQDSEMVRQVFFDAYNMARCFKRERTAKTILHALSLWHKLKDLLKVDHAGRTDENHIDSLLDAVLDMYDIPADNTATMTDKENSTLQMSGYFPERIHTRDCYIDKWRDSDYDVDFFMQYINHTST